MLKAMSFGSSENSHNNTQYHNLKLFNVCTTVKRSEIITYNIYET